MAAPLTPAAVAEMFSVSVRTVTRLAERGELHGVKVGSQWRFSVAAVEAYEAAHGAAAPTTPEPITRQAQRPTQAAPAPIGGLPAGYSPVFPALWGRDEATPAARPAAARGRSTQKTKKRA